MASDKKSGNDFSAKQPEAKPTNNGYPPAQESQTDSTIDDALQKLPAIPNPLDYTQADEADPGSQSSELEPQKKYSWEERFDKSEKLGQGAMGAVYLAFDRKLKRNVAVKVMVCEGMAGSAAYNRFQREAAAMARLSHPNIVAVYDAEMEGDRTWIVMEYVQGRSLAIV
jgi:hypothetical protein